MRPVRLMHSRLFCVGSGGQGNDEPAAPAEVRTANALEIASSPADSLLSSTQRVQAGPGGAGAEGAGAYSHSVLLNVFTVPPPRSRGRQLD
jgi:hypothetical protein